LSTVLTVKVAKFSAKRPAYDLRRRRGAAQVAIMMIARNS